MKISGWGKYPSIDANILLPKTRSHCVELIQQNKELIPRGLGRSYGDSANSQIVLQTNPLNHFVQFDDRAGLLICESGISLREILELVVPKGWFLPVTPGTSYVTVGGAIASDVHGKNHHIGGTFSESLLALDLMLGTGEVLTVTRLTHPDLFRATCGGMGLTGVILTATIQLKKIRSSQIEQTTSKASCLESVCEKFEESSNATYSVAWIDCLAKGANLGRSLLITGEHATDERLEALKTKVLNVPVDAPSSFLNDYSLKVFNTLYYYKNFLRKKTEIVPLKKFFYPLDFVGNWNRLYGKSGFVQHQFVLPKSIGVRGLKTILQVISNSGKGSFLAVLKILGQENTNYLSFPIEGYTLALDFQMSLEAIALIKKIESMVCEMGGKIYLTKDALMSEKTFKATYPQWEKFQEVRAQYGAIGKFSSSQSKRLGLL